MYGQSHRSGRNNTSQYGHNDSATSLPATAPRTYKSSLADHEQRAGAYSPSSRAFVNTSRSMTTPNMSTSMTSSVPAMPAPARTMPNLHGRSHRRAGSGSGSTLHTLETGSVEPFPDLTTSSPVARVKPYLRKLSTPKEDQGKLDLSRPLADNDKLAGLGIQKDVFVPPGRHTRTTSTGSQASMASTSSRPHQPFVHPMRQAPRPYTPPTVRSNSPYDEDEDDFVEDDHRPSFSFRGKRSMSSGSVPHGAPTPLSQTITAGDLGAIPKLTSASQSNLSIISTPSIRASRSRRDTGRSEAATSPSSRTSFDKMSIIGGRRSDTDARMRDERIRAARRKFEEKEADKDRRAEKRQIKQEQRQRAKSDASEKVRPQRPGTSGGLAAGTRTGSALGKYSFNASEERPSPPAPSTSRFYEKQAEMAVQKRPPPSFFQRLFGCGSKR